MSGRAVGVPSRYLLSSTQFFLEGTAFLAGPVQHPLPVVGVVCVILALVLVLYQGMSLSTLTSTEYGAPTP